MKLFEVNSGYFKLDGGAMHGVVPKQMWQKVNPADNNNMCTWAMRTLLIEHGNHLILIDTGMGDKQDEKFFSRYEPHGEDSLQKNIMAAGYSFDDITDVFLTHLHFDHVGGAVRRVDNQLVPTFPKAMYWTNPAHWEEALNPNAREKASFLRENIVPLQESEQLDFIHTENGGEWMTDIQIIYCKGHTANMMLPLINYNGRKILFCADLIPSAAHISLPWVMAYDMRPVDTLKEKEAVLQDAAEQDWLLYFEHDPKIACCSLEQTDKGVRLKEIISVASL